MVDNRCGHAESVYISNDPAAKDARNTVYLHDVEEGWSTVKPEGLIPPVPNQCSAGVDQLNVVVGRPCAARDNGKFSETEDAHKRTSVPGDAGDWQANR